MGHDREDATGRGWVLDTMCTVELRIINPRSPNQLTATAQMRDQQNQHQHQYRQYSCQHKARPGWDERDYRMSNLMQGTSSLARPQEPAQQETKTAKQRSQVPRDWIPTSTGVGSSFSRAAASKVTTHSDAQSSLRANNNSV